MIAGVRAGLDLGRERFLVRVDAALSFALAMALAAVALLVRRASPLGAVDAVLAVEFRYALPVVTLLAVSSASASTRPEEASWPFARFGLSRRHVTLGLWLTAIIRATLVLGPPLVVGVWFAAGGRGPMLRELSVAVGLMALGIVAYVASYACASTFLRRGAGRYVMLGVDFLVGSGSGLFAAPLPRAHLESLLGGEAVMGLSQRGSSFALVAIALVAGVLAWRRIDE